MSRAAPGLSSGSGRMPGHVLIGWVVAFLLSFSLYAATANRGAQWQDSGDRILRVITKDPVGTLGLALSHPLHHYLGRLAVRPNVLEPAFAVTLVSAFGGALAVANVFGCVLYLTRRWWPAVFAAVSLAVAATFWQLATLTETYTLGAALLAGEVWCLAAFLLGRRGGLFGMALFNGLGVANHLLAGLTTPVLVVAAILAWREGRIKFKDIAAACVLWCAGSLPYSLLVGMHLAETGDWGGTVRSALFGTAYKTNVLNTEISAGLLLRGLMFVAYNFPNLLVPLAILGIMRSNRLGLPRSVRWFLLADLIIYAVFVLRYNIPDQQTFFLPVYVLLSVFGGLGVASAMTWPAAGRRAVMALAVILLAATPAVYAVAPHVARRAGVLDAYPQRPYRDNYVYLLTPWSVVENSADRMAEEAVKLAGPKGLIYWQDRMASFALRYKMMRSGLEGVTVEGLPNQQRWADLAEAVQRGEIQVPARVVLIPTDVRKLPPEGLPGYVWVRSGEFFLLTPEAR